MVTAQDRPRAGLLQWAEAEAIQTACIAPTEVRVAAEELGIGRTTLWRRKMKYGLAKAEAARGCVSDT